VAPECKLSAPPSHRRIEVHSNRALQAIVCRITCAFADVEPHFIAAVEHENRAFANSNPDSAVIVPDEERGAKRTDIATIVVLLSGLYLWLFRRRQAPIPKL